MKAFLSRSAFAVLVVFSALVAAPTGLVAWWSFEEGSLAPVKNQVGGGMDGKLVGAGEFVPGRSGRALKLDGKAWVEIPSAAPLNPKGDFSLSFWMKSSQAGSAQAPYSGVFGKYQVGDSANPKGTGFDCILNKDGGLRISARGASAIDTGMTAKKVTDDEWHHVAVSVTSSRVALFVDGKKAGEASGTWTPSANEKSLTLGYRDGGMPGFIGLLDEVKFWSRALSEAEAAAEMTSAAAVPVPAAASVEAAPLVRSNVVKNPGFEVEGDWNFNNWAKNDASGERVDGNPRSGKYSYRLEMKKVVGAVNLQFAQDMAVRPGQAFELRFWMRGKANSKPVNVQFRKGGAPYTTYWSQDVPIMERWTEYVYTAVLSDKTDPADTRFFFNLNEEGGLVWIDDVSVTELPPKDDASPLVGNQVVNGSFEAGRDHWVARFRESGNHANAGEIATERNIQAGLSTPEIGDTPHGRRALRFDVLPQCTVFLSSYFFPLRYGHPATVSLKIKAPAIGKSIEVRIGHGKNHVANAVVKRYKAEKEGWQPFEFTFVPPVSSSRTYYIEMTTWDEGTWMLDGVSVREGDQPIAYDGSNPMNVGWESVDDKHAGNLFDKGEAARFHILAEARGASLPLYGRVLDVNDQVVGRLETTVALKDGTGRAVVTVPTDRFGGFKLELYADAKYSGLPVSDLLYNVVPKLKDPKQVTDSFFGSHFNATPYNLEIARRAGFRWLRLHPPLPTKWWTIEKEKGKKEFFTAGVERAYAMGFKLFGNFDQVPHFYADADPKKPVDTYNKWWNSYPPKDWEEWRKYMVETYAAFGKWVKVWEIWNEPDGGFLSVPPGKTKESAYLEIVQNTARIAREEKMDLTLIGCVVSSLTRPLYSNVLLSGGAELLDAASFHFYFEDQSPEEAPGMTAVEWVKWTKNLKGKNGKPLEAWHTEGGPWLADGASWMRGARVPTSSTLTMADLSGTLVRTIASLKAVGCRRHFQYQAMAHPAGNRVFGDETSTFIDRNGIPFPTLAAHATAVSFLEELDGLGLDQVKAGDTRVVVAHFGKGGKKVDVIWSRIPVKLSAAGGVNWKNADAFDMMGNPVVLSGDTVLTQAPVYIVAK